MLFDLWKTNTKVFLVQLMTALIAYGISKMFRIMNGTEVLVAIIASIALTIAMSIELAFRAAHTGHLSYDERDTLSVFAVALLAALSMPFVLLSLVVATEFSSGAIFAGLAAIYVAYRLAVSRVEMTLEPWQPVFVMLLPFGFGTILGSVYFLNYYRKHGTFSA